MRRSGVFIVNFEHISHLILVFVLLALKTEVISKYRNDINEQQIFNINNYSKFRVKRKPIPIDKIVFAATN